MEVIGKFILNLIADGIATLIHDIFVALLTVIMDFVSKMIVSLWDDSIISAIVSCSSWIAMGVFAIGCILMLYDILEARSEEKPSTCPQSQRTSSQGWPLLFSVPSWCM